jgi:hypothetical protein
MENLPLDDESEHFKGEKFLTKKGKDVLIVVVVVAAMLFIFTGGNPISIIGWQKTPGALFEQRFYSGKYKVIVSENKNTSKEYKLTADIDRHIHCDGPDCGSLAYWVSTIYWPNGGYIEFDTDTCAIGIQHESECEDVDGKSYSILMTNIPAN